MSAKPLKKPQKIETTDFIPPEIEGYECKGFLGSGIWTPVFKYKHIQSGAEYAFKFFNPNEFAQGLQKERGLSELEILVKENLGGNSRSLPNIAYNSLETTTDNAGNRVYFLREEFIDRFLSDKLAEDKPMSIDEILHVGLETANGLKSLHNRMDKPHVHQDVKPENIGYSCDGEIKISDFGITSMGSRRTMNIGHPYVRAPERFLEEPETARAPSDIYLLGSLLYRMFTGDYFLEEELQQVNNPVDVVRSLYSSAKRWNSIVAEKIAKVNAPKPIKKLMERCLCYEDTRIKDGSELVKEVEKAKRKYERSKPMARLKQATIALATIATIISGGFAIQERYSSLESDKIELSDRVTVLEIYEKINYAKLFVNGIKIDDFQPYIEKGEIAGWVNKLGDEKTGIAAYLDANPIPISVFKAVQENGGKTDYESLEPILKKYNINLTSYVSSAYSLTTDNVTRLISSSKYAGVDDKWEEAGKKPDPYIVRLANEHHLLTKGIREAERLERESNYKLEYNDKISDMQDRQGEIAEELTRITGYKKDTIYDLLYNDWHMAKPEKK